MSEVKKKRDIIEKFSVDKIIEGLFGAKDGLEKETYVPDNDYGKTPKQANSKLGLVLEGGGVKGAYHVGALKAFDEEKYDFDGVTGTSIGALNGAVLVQEGFERVLDIWSDVTTTTVFDLDEELVERFKSRDFDDNFRAALSKTALNLKKTYQNSISRINGFVRGHLDEALIRSSKKDFGFVTYNLSRREPFELMKEEVEVGMLVDYIASSAAYPLFPAHEIGGDKYIDGGVWDNMPVNLLARQGYRKMVVVRTNLKAPKRKFECNDLDLLCVVPKEDLGWAMTFDKDNVVKLMEEGYADAKRVLADNPEFRMI